MKHLIFVAALMCAAALKASSPVPLFRLEGQRFAPTVPVVWKAETTNIPENVKVYRVLPQQFSKEAVSYLLSLSGFTSQTVQESADKKTLSWRRYENNRTRLVRSLDIAPTYGYVSYHDYRAVGISTNAGEDVPSRREVERLAMEYVERLGGNTNELCLSHHSGTERKHSFFDKRQKQLVSFVTMRGVMYARQLDGIRFLGAGGRGGFDIDFASHAKVATLEFDWRKLESYQSYKTLNSDEIVQEVREGKAVIAEENGDIPKKPKTLTISKITLLYMDATSGAPEDFVYPIASLDVSADAGTTNATTFYLDCSIISERAANGK